MERSENDDWPIGKAGVELTELKRTRFPLSMLSGDHGQILWSKYSDWVQVSFPSPATDGEWELFSSGAVGYLPFGDGSVLSIRPRVPIESIFRMWAIAEGVKLEQPPGDVGVQTLEDLLDWIAAELARGALHRLGRGLYRAYVDVEEELQTLRGRLDLKAKLMRPWRVELPCEFQELTADVVENQILLAGLFASAYTTRGAQILSEVRKSWWLCLRSGVSPRDVSPRECVGRTYSRLNSDYERLHWLSHFILSGTGPTHEAGQSKLRAFIIQMPRLFERFVAAWLKRNLRTPLRCESQIHLPLDQRIEFIADLVITGANEQPLAVLDTKYKIDRDPDPADIAQVVAYAEHLGCPEAILLYPTRNHRPVEIQVGGVRVRSLPFPLDGDLDSAGNEMVERLHLVS
jgi:5-methylcytosine-specific restriction enzyme subunit McrC